MNLVACKAFDASSFYVPSFFFFFFCCFCDFFGWSGKGRKKNGNCGKYSCSKCDIELTSWMGIPFHSRNFTRTKMICISCAHYKYVHIESVGYNVYEAMDRAQWNILKLCDRFDDAVAARINWKKFVVPNESNSVSISRKFIDVDLHFFFCYFINDSKNTRFRKIRSKKKPTTSMQLATRTQIHDFVKIA